MSQHDRLLTLIDDLYAAPATENGWRVFLDCLCTSVNGTGGSFISINSATQHANVDMTVRTDPEALGKYRQHWGAEDPWGHSPMLDAVGAGRVIVGDELITHSALQ